ncbi:1-acyl-sn-glycerol-3-phosphate acyltransferase [Candidatus Puniceispirillum sp.]|nr:1-acyl-sn-glycerol-3-phosphate acyltransferase [Candidatus Puniceispirillum sp.]
MGPILLFPSRYARLVAKFWGYMTYLLLGMIGITQTVIGDRRLDQQVLYAVKHQSAWETIILCWLLDAPAFVLKRELLRLPIIGWFFLKTGCIPVDRSAGMKALRDIRAAGQDLVKKGRSMLIFPQGTRVAHGTDHPYEIGVFSLYQATGLSVVPVALNSCHVWPRNSWLKYPGKVTVEFLKPIEPGLDRKHFMTTLKQRIEDRMFYLEK